MKEKVLVAYGSTNGSTAEIADYVGEVLAEEGLAVDVRSASDVTDLASYGAVVLGGGLYGGRWRSRHPALRTAAPQCPGRAAGVAVQQRAP
ncbi:hypothetical protein SAFG77S_00941 [Streptomyces afghaniensis]